MLLLPILFGGFYLATPALWDSGILGSFPAPNIGMYFSYAPTVLFQDVDDTVETIRWLNVHADANSCVLVHHIFRSWVSLHLDKSHTVVCFTRDAQMALDVALEHHYDPVYLIWWNEDIGLYELKVPSGFVPVFDSGRISAFEF
jgi:hypothetical protein